MRTLRGQRAVVTGANGTFGKLLCERLAAAGAQVVGLDLAGGRIGNSPVIACDLTDGQQARQGVAQAVELLGGLDLLVNNAGVGGPAPAELPPGEQARRQLEVNLVAAWHTTAAAIVPLERSRGRIVFVSSRMALLPLPLAAAYGVSKRALVAYADALRLEVGSHIGVSVVYPSMVASPIHDASAQAGLSLQGVSRYEPVEGVVAAILGAATARRPRRDIATTGRGRVELFVARHLPSLAARMVRRTITARIAAGDLDAAPLAAGMLRRAGRQPTADHATR
ncbi:SDR family NAD(P)-dependent oxidoreductase [Catellatospora tritici]|uniref:SDR family NAD(P)-dependent oxidoreductase n=1 Tax=Catellatospora tritici TaxID=2851566 RepID=UPI001C2CD2B5|nr:SDR family NAD(P)-dependent oxidoreductase [Catellatospora tritici]MBV1856252.1 SDR family NAD(P)-dependent oxidoreductase [Catellatospora tritici]